MKGISKVSPKQERLIAFLLTERTVDSACAKANVSISSYWRWMQEESFLREYRKARRRILEATTAKLQSITFAAIETLERNLRCGNPAVETRTASVILEQSLKGLELLDIAQRLECLEDLVDRAEDIYGKP